MFKGTCHWLLVSDHWPLIQFILPEARSLEQKRLPHARYFNNPKSAIFTLLNPRKAGLA